MDARPNPLPLTFVRATKETAWEIPAPPPPLKLMPADADPSFEVATIKPNDSGATSMQQLTVNGKKLSDAGFIAARSDLVLLQRPGEADCGWAGLDR